MPLEFDDTLEDLNAVYTTLEITARTDNHLSQSTRKARTRILKTFETFCTTYGFSAEESFYDLCDKCQSIARNASETIEGFLERYVSNSYKKVPSLDLDNYKEGPMKVRSITKVSTMLNHWIHLYTAAENDYFRRNRRQGTQDSVFSSKIANQSPKFRRLLTGSTTH